MKSLIALMLLSLSLPACGEDNNDAAFSIEGEGYKCTLNQTEYDGTSIYRSNKEVIEVLWQTNFYSESHDADSSLLKIRLDGRLQSFIYTDWYGDMMGSHHIFESPETGNKLRLTDQIQSPETLIDSGVYFLCGSISVSNKDETEFYHSYNVEGLCRP